MTVAKYSSGCYVQRMQSNFIFRQCFLVFSQHLLFNKQLFNKCLPCARLCAKHWSCKDEWSLSWTQSKYGADYCKEVYTIIWYQKGPVATSGDLKKKKRKTQLLRRDQHFSFLKGWLFFLTKLECEEWLPVKETECSNVGNAWNSIVRVGCC